MKAGKFLSLCIGVCLSLLVGEMGLRLYYFSRFTTRDLMLSNNEKLIYEHRPSITFVNRYGITVSYNSLGFIGKEIGDKPQGAFRILALGDSVTAATYLPEEQRYINIVGRNLELKTNGPRIEIINAAVGGYNTWQELEMIKEKGLLVKPDLIIIGICLNDYVEKKPNLKRTWFNKVSEDFNDGSRARYFNPLYQKSALYKFIYDFVSSLRRTGYGWKGYQHYLEEYNFDIKLSDFQKWKKPFIEIMALTKKNKIKILFVIFPLHNQIIQGESVSYKPLSDFFKEEGAYFLDLMKYFNGLPREGKTLFIKRDIIHLDALGHNIAAEAIANYILENKILE